jgi:prevent-host-death family protein
MPAAAPKGSHLKRRRLQRHPTLIYPESIPASRGLDISLYGCYNPREYVFVQVDTYKENPMLAEKPQRVTLRSTEVQRNFREVVNRAGSGHEHIIVERDGLPVIVMISLAEYNLLMRERGQREERLKKLEASARWIGQEMERRGLSEEQVLAQLEETQQQLYEERYGKPAH